MDSSASPKAKSGFCAYAITFQTQSTKRVWKWLDSRCCFGKEGVTSRELSSDTAILLQLSTTEWLFSNMPVKNCWVITKPGGRRKRARVAYWKRISMDRQGPLGSCGKEALNRQILKVVYVQYVEIMHLQASLSPTGYGASAVVRKNAQTPVHDW